MNLHTYIYIYIYTKRSDISNPSTKSEFQSIFATINRFVTTPIITFSWNHRQRERERYTISCELLPVNSALRSYLPPRHDVSASNAHAMIRPQSSRLPLPLSINRERGGGSRRRAYTARDEEWRVVARWMERDEESRHRKRKPLMEFTASKWMHEICARC